MPGRKKAIELLSLQLGERVLIIGIGTGADLPLLSTSVDVTGIDLSPEMLTKARLKLDQCPIAVKLIEGDAQTSLVEPTSFDAVILNLILSVIPDGNACLHSALCALKANGRAVIFDKFLPEGKKPLFARRLLNIFSTLLGTDVNRRLSDLILNCSCAVTHQESRVAGGLYRIILLKKF